MFTSDSVGLRLGLPRCDNVEPTPTASHPRESGRILVTPLCSVKQKIAENLAISYPFKTKSLPRKMLPICAEGLHFHASP